MPHFSTANSRKALLIFSSHPDKEVVRKGLRSRAEGRKIYHQILLHLLNGAVRATHKTPFDIVIASDRGDRKNLDRIFRDLPGQHSYRFIEHQKARFGEKLQAAMEQLSNWGYQQAIVIGNDCLDVDSAVLTDTFSKLNTGKTVVGPAPDGGFYLLGLSHISVDVLDRIPWCTSAVCDQLLANLAAAYARVALLPERADFDSFKAFKTILARNTSSYLAALVVRLKMILQVTVSYHKREQQSPPQMHVLPENWQIPPPQYSALSIQ